MMSSMFSGSGVYQRTIGKSVDITGIGLHKGASVRLRLEPLGANSGILFHHQGTAQHIPLSVASVVDTTMATVIGRDEQTIVAVEHLLATLYAYGIDNLRIVIDGGEIPIMDGSALPFSLLLDKAGIAMQTATKKVMRILQPIEVREGKKWVRLTPYHESRFDFAIDFPHPAIGQQSYSFRLSREAFNEEIAPARTFGFIKDLHSLRSRNLALGASLDNAIGLDEHGILNSEGLRYDNEFVRHKIMDAMGDMMMVGHLISGHYSAFAAGHTLNHLLTQKLLSCSSHYEIISADQLVESRQE